MVNYLLGPPPPGGGARNRIYYQTHILDEDY